MGHRKVRLVVIAILVFLILLLVLFCFLVPAFRIWIIGIPIALWAFISAIWIFVILNIPSIPSYFDNIKKIGDGIDTIRKGLDYVKGKSVKKSAESTIEEIYVKDVKRTISSEKFLEVYQSNEAEKYIPLHTRIYGSYDGFTTSLRDPEKLIRVDQRNLERRVRAVDEHRTALFAESKTNRNYQIIGPPGSGKTLYLKYLEWLLVNDKIEEASKHLSWTLPPDFKSCIPIYVDLAEWVKSNYGSHGSPNQEAFLKFVAGKLQNPSDKESFSRFLNDKVQILDSPPEEVKGNLLFLLDGLDEIIETDRERVIKCIEDITNNYKSSYFIASKRFVNAGQKILEKFEHRVMEDFCPQDIDGIVMHWNVVKMENILDENPRLQAMAGLPLALEKIKEKQGSAKVSFLPRGRVKLYESISKDLFVRWGKSVSSSGSEATAHTLFLEERQKMIEYIAWDMHDHDSYKYTDEEIKKAIERGVSKITIAAGRAEKSLFNELIISNGLIKADVTGKSNYRFLNVPLQEFFAAKYMMRENMVTEDFVKKNYVVPWWEEVLLLCPGCSESEATGAKATQIIEWLYPEVGDEKFSSKILYIGRMLALYSDSISNELQNTIKLALREIARDNKLLLIEREEAGRVLASLGMAYLRAANEQSLAQMAANGHIDNTGNESLPYSLSPLLLPHFKVGRVGEKVSDPESVINNLLCNLEAVQEGSLRDVLTDPHLTPDIVFDYIAALGVVGKRNLANTLCKLLDVSPSGKKDIPLPVKERIARVLGNIGSWDEVGDLVGLLAKSDEDIPYTLKWAIGFTLGMICSRKGCLDRERKLLTEEENLINRLKENSNPDDKYILWSIVMMFATFCFVNIVKDSSSANEVAIDVNLFDNADPITQKAAYILLSLQNSSKNDLLDKLLALGEEHNAPENVWHFICDTVGLIADDEAISNKLGKCCESKSEELKKHVLQTQMLVERREKTKIPLSKEKSSESTG